MLIGHIGNIGHIPRRTLCILVQQLLAAPIGKFATWWTQQVYRRGRQNNKSRLTPPPFPPTRESASYYHSYCYCSCPGFSSRAEPGRVVCTEGKVTLKRRQSGKASSPAERVLGPRRENDVGGKLRRCVTPRVGNTK